MTRELAGISHRQMAELLAPLSREQSFELTGDRVETRFAWATFSTLVEPGDTDARALIEALGPTAALRAVVDGNEPDVIVDRLHEIDQAAAHNLSPRLASALARWKPRVALATATRALTSAAHLRAVLLTPDDPAWPETLDALGDGAPLALWMRGDPARLSELRRSIALVGARAATGYGEHVAMESAAGLSDRGFAIVSGGAYGIDGAAHRATLASEQTTVAFLAGGVDRLYPAGNSRLLQRIADRGLLIGELPCGSPPTRWRFLQRNRLIAAVATATVVVEAGRRSGSLNTAGHAATMGRPLGAVPGPITSPASSGCHRLIREYDAVCVTSADEMAELADTDATAQAIGHAPPSTPADDQRTHATVTVDAEETRLRDALTTRRPRTIADIAARSGLATADVMAALGRLELAGWVKEEEGQWYKVH
ncbi:DNA-processing protein DprA [Leifsonia lichenia]